MGKDVSNYIIVDYNNKENLILIKKYLDSIFSDKEFMLYDYGIRDINRFNFLDRSRIDILEKNICSIDDKILLCFVESRKCDLFESFESYIKPSLNSIELAKIFLYDAEDGYDLTEIGIKEKCYETYFDEDMSDDCSDPYVMGRFILKRCGIG